MSITIKYGKGYEETWAGFTGTVPEGREDIIDYFGVDRATVTELTLSELVVNVTNLAHGKGNVAAMLGVAALTGAAEGWLPPSYGVVGGSLLAAVCDRVDELGRVAGASAAPHFDRPGHSPEAQAFLLLADSAHRSWRAR